MLRFSFPATLDGRYSDFCHEFFRDCHVVTMAPGSVFFAGEYSVLFGHPALCMAVPLYCLVGLRRRSDWRITVECRYAKPDLDSWRDAEDADRDLSEIDLKKMNEAAASGFDWEGELAQHLVAYGHDGVDIKAFFEVPPRCGLNSSGAFSMALALALLTLRGDVDAWQDVRAWHESQLMSLRNSGPFNEVFRLSWKLESIFHGNSSSGMGPLTAWAGAPNGLPVVYFTQHRGDARSGALPDSVSYRIDPGRRPQDKEMYDTIGWWAYRIDELASLPDGVMPSEWRFPGAFCLMYSGRSKEQGSGFEIGQFKKSAGKCYEDAMALFRTSLSRMAPRDLPAFWKMLKRIDRRDEFTVTNVFADALGVIALRGINAFIRGAGPNSEDAAAAQERDALIRVMNFAHGVLRGLYLSPHVTDRVWASLLRDSHRLGDPARSSREFQTRWAAKITGAGGGGDLFCFTANYPMGDFLNALDNVFGKYPRQAVVHFRTWGPKGGDRNAPGEEWTLPSRLRVHGACVVALEAKAIGQTGGRCASFADATCHQADRAIELIKESGSWLESKRDSFRHSEEEVLRDHLVAPLRSAYIVETEPARGTRRGYTDFVLTLRDGSQLQFLGECKRWNGPAGYAEGFGQLLERATWEPHLFLVCFYCKGRQGLPAVMEKARASIAQRWPEAQLRQSEETAFVTRLPSEGKWPRERKVYHLFIDLTETGQP